MKTQRKITYRMYPSAAQCAALGDALALHCRVSNTLIEEHRRRHEAAEPALSFVAMCQELTAWRRRSEALSGLNAQALQVTAKRVALAFSAFFRRVKAGDTPGYPRFKSAARYSGWGYKTYGDGWRLTGATSDAKTRRLRHRSVRLSGIGDIPLRGKARFSGTPKTAEVLRKGQGPDAKWYLSVTCDVAPAEIARRPGAAAGAFDWGLKNLLTLVQAQHGEVGGSAEVIDNPRWLKRRLAALKTLQQAVSAEEIRAKAAIGLKPEDPWPALLPGAKPVVTGKLRRLYAQVRALHGKIARQRHDFYHKLAAQLVSRFAFLATEALAVKAMVRRPKSRPAATNIDATENVDAVPRYLPNGASAKAGLNRGILDAAPSTLLGMVRTKAAEAGSVFAQANTRVLKPTQRCHRCGTVEKKTLSQRDHVCTCGCRCDRDENAAKVMLRWLLEGDWWKTDPQDSFSVVHGLGTSLAGRSATPPALPETLSIAA